jgi:topoisomerase-4 subunit A
MIKEIESDAKTYGDDRRTLIEAAERAVMEVKVVEEPVTVIISQKGWLRSRQGHGHDASQFGFKTGDSLYGAIECLSTDDLVAFSDRGRVYTVAVSSLPSARGDGQPVTSMIELEPGAHIVHMVAGDAARRFVLGTRSGYGFIATLGDLTTRQRSGKQFLTLDKGDVMLRPLPLRDQDSQLAMMARKGRFLVVELAELKKLSGGGRGTILMGLDSGDALDQWVSVGPQGLEVHGIYRNKQTVITLDAQALAEYVGKRARKGKLLDVKVKGARLHPAA